MVGEIPACWHLDKNGPIERGNLDDIRECR